MKKRLEEEEEGEMADWRVKKHFQRVPDCCSSSREQSFETIAAAAAVVVVD